MTWTTERIELLKSHFEAGLSCEQIARKIGVTRNAVIGKLNRLGLTRLKSGLSVRRERVAAGGASHPRVARPARPKVTNAAAPRVRKPVEDSAAEAEVVVIMDRTCSLLDLTEFKCRWPIGEPGSEGFCFCGNERADGLSYCSAHARMAYRRKAA